MMKNFILKRWKKIIIALALVAIVLFFFFRSKNNNSETANIQRGDIKEELILSPDLSPLI